MGPPNVTALELWAEKPQGLFEPLIEILLEIIRFLMSFFDNLHEELFAQFKTHLYPLTTWTGTFALIFTLVSSMGFGPLGVVGGSWAAGTQSALYAGATPAGGWFATLTSWGMRGVLKQITVGVASSIATVLAAIVSYLTDSGFEAIYDEALDVQVVLGEVQSWLT